MRDRPAHTAPKRKSSGDWHVNHSSMGMGDYYGTGIKAKLGKVVEGMGMKTITPKKLKTPPTSVA